MKDFELVKECLKGKPDAQRQFYEFYAPRMLGVCYRYASSRDEAEDFLQEAFIIIFKKLHQYRAEGELGAWIRRIVVNTALNCIKAKHRIIESSNIIAIDQIPNTSILEDPVSDRELMELVHQLPVGYKTVFNLYAIEGYSHDEIGKMLNIKASTSRSQYARAREMLMNKINPKEKIKNNAK